MRELHAFDLDHTLLKVNCSYMFGIYLYKKGIFSFWTMVNLWSSYGLHKVGVLSITEMQEWIFQKLFKEKSALDFIALAQGFASEQLQSMLYQPAILALKQAEKQGHHTAIFSSSPDFLVKVISQRLGVYHLEATEYALDERSQFSHISKWMLGETKAHALHTLAKRLGIDESKTVAYSDSEIDLPFLKAARVAVGVNPDAKLRRICLRNQWEIL